jgi:hypothetical protein
MNLGTVGSYPVTIGWLIALAGLIIVIILMVLGQLETRIGLLFCAAFLSRLI